MNSLHHVSHRHTGNIARLFGAACLLILPLTGCAPNPEQSVGVATITSVSTSTEAQSSFDTTSEPEKEDYCRQDRERLELTLNQILAEVTRIRKKPSQAALVELDARLREVIRNRPKYSPCASDDSLYRKEWAAMGVELTYDVTLGYSGLLLRQAHQLNPDSQLRAHTLFATILPPAISLGYGDMPDIEAAFQYASEFPDGPFAEEVHLIIGEFYKDLFMVLRAGSDGYKVNCYDVYITDESREEQMDRAKRIALEHYQKVLQLNAGNERAALYLQQTQEETVSHWSFCGC